MKGKSNKTKIVFFTCLVILVSIFLVITTNAASITTQVMNVRGTKLSGMRGGTNDLSVPLTTATSSIQKNKSIPKEYADFALGLNGNLVTSVSGLIEPSSTVKNWWYTGEYSYLNDPGDSAYTSILNDSSINNLSVTYKGVDVYNGNLIDVKATITGFEKADDAVFTNGRQPMISIYKNDERYNNKELGIITWGLKWVTIKYEFYKSGTNELVNVKE